MARKKPDQILLVCTVFLIIVGALMVFGISAPFSQESYGKTYWFLAHQLIFGILPGIFLGILVFNVKISDLKKLAPLLFGINLFLILLAFWAPTGVASGGAKRWTKLGPISFQPSEFLKITLIMYLAAWLEKKSKKNLAGLGSFLAILIPVSLALFFQPDISTLALLLSVSLFLYFLAETPVWHSILMTAIGASLIFFLITLAPYRMERFLVFLIPQLDPMGMGYQIKQAQITVGSGGIFGQGLGMSKQKFGFLPHARSDSIFAIFCEETGVLGGLILIIFFLIFVFRGVKIAKENENRFIKLVSSGICLQIIIQTFLNMGSMIGVVPLTGIPLPFISYGGTHIVVELIEVGILLNISKNI
jgi:cell division protein FtsW